MIREFRLSPRGSGRGVSCDPGGAFIGSIPLLKCEGKTGRQYWAPRAIDELSEELGSQWSLPIDMASKAGGLKAICRALNDGNIARAQIATVLLGIPDAPKLADSNRPRDELIKFIRNLFHSNLIKADWDPDEHPRWPAGTPDSQGGRFAPKDESDPPAGGNTSTASSSNDRIVGSSNPFLEYGAQEGHLDDGVYHPDSDPAELDPTAGSPQQLLLNRLNHDLQVQREMWAWRKLGFQVVPNITFEDPRTGIRIIADYAVSAWVPDPLGWLLTDKLEPIFVRDVKTGYGGLTKPNQAQVYPYILRGGQVIPRGFNAGLAGFEVDELTVIGPIFHVGRDAPDFTNH